jgi:putative transposase
MNAFPQRKFLPHSPPSWVRDDAIWFITINCSPRGQNQLASPPIAESIREALETYRIQGRWWPHLVLLMPDHVHGLFSFAQDAGLATTVKAWKHFLSRQCGISWQRDFFDHRLRKDESFVEKASYIRMNPVRANIVQRVEDWPYTWTWPVLR